MKQRADGLWEGLVPLEIGANGRRKYKHVYAESKAKLKEKLRDLENQKGVGVNISEDKPTITQWSIRWLESEKKDKEEKTYDMYKGMVNNHIIPEFGQAKINQVKPVDIKDLLNKKNEIMSKQTLHVLRITLNQIFKFAVVNGLIPRNIVEDVQQPKNDKVKTREALTSKQQKILNEVCRKHPYGKLPMIMMYAGLRKGEVLALLKKDISDDSISVTKTFTYANNQPKAKNKPKTKAGLREVPIFDSLRPFLKTNTSNGLYAFEKDGKVISDTQFRHIWKSINKEYEKAAGNTKDIKVVEPITAHMLRHTFATLLYEADVDIKTAIKWFGHADINILLQVYAHLSEKKEHAAIEKFNAHMKSS